MLNKKEENVPIRHLLTYLITIFNQIPHMEFHYYQCVYIHISEYLAYHLYERIHFVTKL